MSGDEVEFPVKTRQASAEINGRNTDMLVSEYADKIMIVITQLDNIGQMLMASVDAPSATQSNALSGVEPLTSVKFLLGDRLDELAPVYASHIMARIAMKNPSETRQLVLGLGLPRIVSSQQDPDEESTDLFRKIIEALSSNFPFLL